MLRKKMWRTMRLYRAQFLSMILIVAIGVAMFAGFNIEWKSIDVNVFQFYEDTNFADYRIVSESETGFTVEDKDAIAALDDTERAARYVSANADVREEEGDTLALTVTEDPGVSNFLVSKGEAYDQESMDGIWLSEKYAEANDIAIGDTLTLDYDNFSFAGEVQGLIRSGEYTICVRDDTQLMPDYKTHGYAYISPAMYESVLGFAYYPQINVLSAADKEDFTEDVDAALGETTLVLSRDETIAYTGPTGEITEGKTMASILPVFFLLIAVLIMVTTMHRVAAQEKTQIGTLKALGFRNRTILRHYTAYALMVSLIGSVIGVALGYPIARAIMDPDGTMGSYIDMPDWDLYMPRFAWFTILGMIALMTLVGYLSVRQMLRGTAAETLRPYSPKRMKALFIERFAFWQHLGFGARWNLRDILRHKARSFMSVLGVFGCILIAVACLGMRDTMDEFMDAYYDGAANYASCIYLSDAASEAEADALADRYAGDTCGSVSVQIEDKAVSLDVYNLTHDRVRILDEDSETIDIGDDGAYVCRRLAEAYDLAVGDHFEISPYGSDESYELEVADITSSLSENIVITPAYADALGIDYRITAIYTDTDKGDVAADTAIASVQSKQKILDSFDTFLEIMNTMVFLLVLVGVILGLIVLYTLGVMSYTERYREMATLKVVGFRNRKIGTLLIQQNLWVTVVGIVIGLPAAKAILGYLITELASEYELSAVIRPGTYLIGIAVTLAVSLLVSLLVGRKNRRIDMVEALKSAE